MPAIGARTTAGSTVSPPSGSGGSAVVVGSSVAVTAPRVGGAWLPSPGPRPIHRSRRRRRRRVGMPHRPRVTRQLPVPLAVAEPVRRRLGIFTTADLAAQGVTEREVQTAVRTGAWVRLRTGVFVQARDLAEIERTGRRPGLDALTVTTVLNRPSAVLSGATAAWVWGLPRPRGSANVVHLTDPQHWRRGPGWLMTRAVLPDDEVTVRGAYRLTTPARTLVDVARAWPELHAVAAVDAALLRHLTTREEMRRVLGRMAKVPGIPRAVRALELADGRAESWLETCGRLTFAALGLP